MSTQEQLQQFKEYLYSFIPSPNEFYSYDRGEGQRQYRSRIKQLLENHMSKFILGASSRHQKGRRGSPNIFGREPGSVIVDPKHFVAAASKSWFPPRIEEIVDVDGLSGRTVLRVVCCGIGGAEVSLVGRSDELIYLSGRTGANVPYAVHRNRRTREKERSQLLQAVSNTNSGGNEVDTGKRAHHDYLNYIREHLYYTWIPVKELFSAYRSMRLRLELMPLAGLQRTRLHLFTTKDRIAFMQKPTPRISSIEDDEKYISTPPASAYTSDKFASHVISRIKAIVRKIHQTTSRQGQQNWTYLLVVNIPFAPFLAASRKVLRQLYLSPSSGGDKMDADLIGLSVLEVDNSSASSTMISMAAAAGNKLVKTMNEILQQAETNFSTTNTTKKKKESRNVYSCKVHVALVDHVSTLVSDTTDSLAIGNTSLKCDMILYLDLSADVDRVLEAYRVATPTADVYTYLNLAARCKTLRVRFDSNKIVKAGRLQVSVSDTPNSHYIPNLDEEVFGRITQCKRIVLKPDYTLDALSRTLCVLGTNLSRLTQEYKERNSIERHFARINSYHKWNKQQRQQQQQQRKQQQQQQQQQDRFSDDTSRIEGVCKTRYEDEKVLIAHLFRTNDVIQGVTPAARESARHYYNIGRGRRDPDPNDLETGKRNVWLIQLLRFVVSSSSSDNVCTSVGWVYGILSNAVNLFTVAGASNKQRRNNGIPFKRSGVRYTVVANATNKKSPDHDNELFTRLDDRIPVILTQYSTDALHRILKE